MILVIGDVMIDQYLICGPPRLDDIDNTVALIQRHRSFLGGAGHVYALLRDLKEDTSLISVVGTDRSGQLVHSAIDWRRRFLIQDSGPTTIKTRIFVDFEDGSSGTVVRADHDRMSISGSAESSIISTIRAMAPQISVFVVSDYGKGVVTEGVMDTIREVSDGRPIIVDPKRDDLSFYKGTTLVTPNDAELRRSGKSQEEWEREGVRTLHKMGERGVRICGHGLRERVLPDADRVVDTTGAGDAIIAGLASSIRRSLNLESHVYLRDMIMQAVRDAVKIADECVSRFGTETISGEIFTGEDHE